MADPDLVEKDSTAFVVYVPPVRAGNTANGNIIVEDATVESCIRLGVAPLGPGRLPQSTADETTTYNHAVSGSQTLSQLSLPTYEPTSGIALLTPGTINLVAAQGVNTTSGSYTNSVSGPSYTITQDSGNKDIISATYSSKDFGLGRWSTLSFNQASTVSVNTLPLQASILFGPTYSVSGPLVLSNNYGFMWNSTIGFSVTATLGRTTSIGTHTIVVTDLDGSNQAYYTKNQASTAGEGFTWTVPTQKLFKVYDAKQALYCELMQAGAIAVDALAVVYALSGLGIANNDSPTAVQKWLWAAEPVAIICTALNGIFAALGIALGKWVDDQTQDSSPNNKFATQVTIQEKSIELATLTGSSDSDPLGANLKLVWGKGSGKITLTTGSKSGATITLDDNNITIEAATITLKGAVSHLPSSPPASQPLF